MTAPLRILGRASSINVRKVLWTCREIGIEFQREDFGSGFAPTDTPELTAAIGPSVELILTGRTDTLSALMT